MTFRIISRLDIKDDKLVKGINLDTAHEIRDGHITREEGIGLMKQFEGEYPSKYEDEFINYLGIDKDILKSIIDSWRLEHIWQKQNDIWQLKNPIT